MNGLQITRSPCPACGKLARENARFCTVCGSPLENPEEVALGARLMSALEKDIFRPDGAVDWEHLGDLRNVLHDSISFGSSWKERPSADQPEGWKISPILAYFDGAKYLAPKLAEASNSTADDIIQESWPPAGRVWDSDAAAMFGGAVRNVVLNRSTCLATRSEPDGAGKEGGVTTENRRKAAGAIYAVAKAAKRLDAKARGLGMKTPFAAMMTIAQASPERIDVSDARSHFDGATLRPHAARLWDEIAQKTTVSCSPQGELVGNDEDGSSEGPACDVLRKVKSTTLDHSTAPERGERYLEDRHSKMLNQFEAILNQAHSHQIIGAGNLFIIKSSLSEAMCILQKSKIEGLAAGFAEHVLLALGTDSREVGMELSDIAEELSVIQRSFSPIFSQ